MDYREDQIKRHIKSNFFLDCLLDECKKRRIAAENVKYTELFLGETVLSLCTKRPNICLSSLTCACIYVVG